MKHLLLLLCSLFVLPALHAQVGSASSISVHAGGGLGYRSIDLQSDNAAFASTRQQLERPGFSWSGGVSVGRQLGPHLWFRTGFRIVNTSYQTNEEFTRFANSSGGFTNLGSFAVTGSPFGFISGSGIIRGPNGGLLISNNGTVAANGCSLLSSICPVSQVRVDEFYVNFQQLEIPLLVRYEYGLNRLKPFGEAGINLNYLAFSRFYEVRNGQKGMVHDRDLLGPGRLGVAVSLSLGATYSLNEFFDVFLQPVIRVALTPVKIGEDGLTEKPRSLLLEAGVRKIIWR
jgi:hypothetical protein